MTPKRKPLSALARLTASHMRLLKVQRGQIAELGHLRTEIFAQRQLLLEVLYEITRHKRSPEPPTEFDVPPPQAVHELAQAVREWGVFPDDWPRL